MFFIDLFSEISRGVIPLEYLEYSGDSLSVDEWVNSLEESILNHQGQGKELINGDKKESPLGKVGGFTLLYGKLELNDTCTSINNLNILSNRGDRGKVHVPLSESTIELDDSVEHQTTFGLSNSLYFDPWPKVKLGQELLRKCIKTSIVKKQNLPELLNSCFDVLSNDTFDKSIADNPDLSFTTKSLELRNSIFIPPIELGFGIPAVGDGPIGQMGPGGATIGKYYGTRTQTVILLDKSGELHYFEKNLHNSDDLDDGCNEVKHFHFNIK